MASLVINSAVSVIAFVMAFFHLLLLSGFDRGRVSVRTMRRQWLVFVVIWLAISSCLFYFVHWSVGLLLGAATTFFGVGGFFEEPDKHEAVKRNERRRKEEKEAEIAYRRTYVRQTATLLADASADSWIAQIRAQEGCPDWEGVFKALAQVRSPESITAAIDTLRRSDTSSDYAIKALISMGDLAIDQLIAALNGAHPKVHGWNSREDLHLMCGAAEALGEIGGLKAAQALTAVIGRDWDVTKIAAIALGRMKYRPAVEPLKRELAQPSYCGRAGEDPRLPGIIKTALASIGEAERP